MKQIVEQLKSHVAAGYQPMPRGDAPPDDTLAQALAEIEQSKCQGGTASPYGIMKRPVRTLEKTRRGALFRFWLALPCVDKWSYFSYKLRPLAIGFERDRLVALYARAYRPALIPGFGCEPTFERNCSNTMLNASGCWIIARWRPPGMMTSLAPGIQLAAPSVEIRNNVRVASPRLISAGILIWRS